MANGDGLDISEEQFMSMNSKQRDLTMFRNMIYIRKKFKDYKLNKKIQYVWLICLTVFVGLKRFLI